MDHFTNNNGDVIEQHGIVLPYAHIRDHGTNFIVGLLSAYSIHSSCIDIDLSLKCIEAVFGFLWPLLPERQKSFLLT